MPWRKGPPHRQPPYGVWVPSYISCFFFQSPRFGQPLGDNYGDEDESHTRVNFFVKKRYKKNFFFPTLTLASLPLQNLLHPRAELQDSAVDDALRNLLPRFDRCHTKRRLVTWAQLCDAAVKDAPHRLNHVHVRTSCRPWRSCVHRLNALPSQVPPNLPRNVTLCTVLLPHGTSGHKLVCHRQQAAADVSGAVEAPPRPPPFLPIYFGEKNYLRTIANTHCRPYLKSRDVPAVTPLSLLDVGAR